MARHPLVSRLALDQAAITADLGLAPSADERELDPIRTKVVVASAAAGLPAPIATVADAPETHGEPDAALDRLRRAGFGGCLTGDPAELPLINDAFAATTVGGQREAT